MPQKRAMGVVFAARGGVAAGDCAAKLARRSRAGSAISIQATFGGAVLRREASTGAELGWLGPRQLRVGLHDAEVIAVVPAVFCDGEAALGSGCINAGHCATNPRYFSNLTTGKILTI
jgi:hypothetical protein